MKYILTIFTLLTLSLQAKDISQLTFKNDIVPLMKKYCYKCHDDDVQKGDLNMLKTLEVPDTITKNLKTWKKVIEQVHTGEMPPKKPFLSHIKRNQLLEWLDFKMKDIDWTSVKNAGHVTLPRLTRTEYNNTIRDLLGWDNQPGSKFGEDGIGASGFNNDRDGLFVSAAQAEKYFDAAEKLMNDFINSSLPAETKVIEAETMFITDELTIPQKWGYMVGRTQDTVYTFVPIKRKGFYELTVRGWGHKISRSHIPFMKVLIDNKQVATARLNASEENKADYKMIIFLKEGNRQISFNGVKTAANVDEYNIAPNPVKNINIFFGSIPLGDSAKNLCTMGLNFMALDRLTLVGPLKSLPKEIPTKEPTFTKTKKVKVTPFAKPGKLSTAKLTSKSLQKFIKSLNGVQNDFNKLRKTGPQSSVYEIEEILIKALANQKRNEAAKKKLFKKLKDKDAAELNKYLAKNRPVFATNMKVVEMAKRFKPKNGVLTKKQKAEIIKKYSGKQWLYTKAGVSFTPPPNIDKVVFVKPGSGVSEKQAATKIIKRFASKAFRQAVNKTDLDQLLSLYEIERKKKVSHLEALKLPLSAVLIAPKFLYRYELASSSDKKEFKLNDFQLASRLSYFLWMSMPDDELFKLAEAGKLSQPDILKSQVQRMLKSPKLKAFSKTFGEQWLGYHELGKSKVPDEMTFPQFTEEIRNAMFTETEMYIHNLIAKNGNMLEVLDSNYTYLNDKLAKHYRIKGVSGSNFRKVILKDKVRGGILGMGSVLAATSQPVRTSPVDRGTWVLETLMGKHLPAPPADIPPLPDNAGGKEAKMTLRQSLEKHRADEQCASCHDKIDPIGFGLENFDPIGRWRSNNFGRKIDAKGKLPNGDMFTNPKELRELLVKNTDDFSRNMSERFLSFALGRKLQYYDEPVLRNLSEGFAQSGFKVHNLIMNIVNSHPFQHQSDSR
jgi:hypothetical protein